MQRQRKRHKERRKGLVQPPADSQRVAITPHPEQSSGRPSEGTTEEGYTRLAKILVPMLREAMDDEAAQADSETKGASNDPET